jgi:DNA-binding CsgD family transcriptional regulator
LDGLIHKTLGSGAYRWTSVLGAERRDIVGSTVWRERIVERDREAYDAAHSGAVAEVAYRVRTEAGTVVVRERVSASSPGARGAVLEGVVEIHELPDPTEADACCFTVEADGSVALTCVGAEALAMLGCDVSDARSPDVLDRLTDGSGRLALAAHRARISERASSWATFPVVSERGRQMVLVWSDVALEFAGRVPGFLVAIPRAEPTASGAIEALLFGSACVYRRTDHGGEWIVPWSRDPFEIFGIPRAPGTGRDGAMVAAVIAEDQEAFLALLTGFGTRAERFRIRSATGLRTLEYRITGRFDTTGRPIDHVLALDVSGLSDRTRTSPLAARRQEVLDLMADGRSTAEIATIMTIAPVTVRNHVAAVLGALDAHTRIEAVAEARRRGWIRS